MFPRRGADSVQTCSGRAKAVSNQFPGCCVVARQTVQVKALEPERRDHHPPDQRQVVRAGHGDGDEGDGSDVVIEETSKPF
jgi:hypothetical protein